MPRLSADAALMAGSEPIHAVQFYENEPYLAAAVSDYLATGLRAGQPVLVIATPEHRDAFTLRLKAKGLDVDRARQSGQLTMLDAREMLATFMSDGMPDAERFKASIGGALTRSACGTNHTTARAYGEMVDLLWKEGNPRGALRVEEMWNELAKSHSFLLLCAYGMSNFTSATDSEAFEAICRNHEHVIPTERYTQSSDDDRMRDISILQQRAQALETEVENRKALERELVAAAIERETLLERERAARAEAQAANRAKSEFLAVMSHELRTPLNAIGGYVQLVELGVHGPLTDPQKEALGRVQRSQRHLLSLINDVLNLVRVELGRIECAVEEISLAGFLSEVTSLVEPMLAARKLTCEVAAPSEQSGVEVTSVRGDRDKIQQILLNLLSNAIKFTPEGGSITVSVTASPDSAEAACINVMDTGIGIPETKLEAVFEPFVQLSRRQQPDQGGVGLGLAISRDLARLMGGDLTVRSTLGEGTTFTLTLPRA